jgi:hypothetical protein
MFKLAPSFHVTQPIWSLENRGIIQDDAYFLPLEFAQLLEVKNKIMKIIL